MHRVIANEFLSLDGVAQAPGGADEDTSGGFGHGGWWWHIRETPDEIEREWLLGYIREADGFLLGRRTYETFAAYWPNASGEQQVMAELLNSKPKYVVSSTLAEPLEWQNSRLLDGDVPDAVAGLKEVGDGELHVIGSTELVRTLIAHDLVDELRLLIDPVLLGGGKRIFQDDGVLRRWRLNEGRVASTGAIFANYVPAT